MKKLFSILCILLILSQVLLCISSCGNSKDPSSITGQKTNDQNLEDQAPILDNLPLLDFDGDNFVIATRDNSNYKRDFLSSENSETLSNVVFERNERVQDRLNLSFEFAVLGGAGGDADIYVEKCILAGTKICDLFQARAYDAVEDVLEGNYLDVSDFPYLDFSQPWWFTDYMNDIRVGDKKCYLMLGDLSVGSIYKLNCYYFNKDMYRAINKDPEELYKMVLDGNWTFEQLLALVKLFEDPNEELADPLQGQLGILNAIWRHPSMLLCSSGNSLTAWDANGIPSLNNSSRVIDVLNDIFDLFYNTEGAYSVQTEEFDVVAVNKFTSGTLFLMLNNLGAASQVVAMEDDYGLLPLPKADETVESYGNVLGGANPVFAVPRFCVGKEKVIGAVLEAMNSESFRLVTPVIVDTLLKTRYAKDTQTAQVVDIIMRNAGEDLGNVTFKTCGQAMEYILRCYYNRDPSFSSAIKGRKEMADAGYGKLVDFYLGETVGGEE